MGRRQLIKTLSTVGFSVAAAAHITADDVKAAASDQVPIVVGYSSGDDPDNPQPVTKNVPADWYNGYRHATKVHQKHTDRLLDIEGVKSVLFDPGEYGGVSSSLTVLIHRNHEEKARGKIPTEINGVPVEVGLVDGYELGCGSLSYNSGHYPLECPGSVQVCANDGDVGTLSGRIYDRDTGESYFLVPNHLYTEGDNIAPYDEPLYQPNTNYDALGTVAGNDCWYDVLWLDPANAHEPMDEIEDASPSRYVNGWFSRAGLSDLKSAGEPVEKYGCRTGRTSGQIESTDAATSFYGCNTKYGQLAQGDSSDFNDGDSGSMAYHGEPLDGGGYSSDYIWVGGMCNARTADFTSLYDFVYGTSCWKLDNQMNWSWGGHYTN